MKYSVGGEYIKEWINPFGISQGRWIAEHKDWRYESLEVRCGRIHVPETSLIFLHNCWNRFNIFKSFLNYNVIFHYEFQNITRQHIAAVALMTSVFSEHTSRNYLFRDSKIQRGTTTVHYFVVWRLFGGAPTWKIQKPFKTTSLPQGEGRDFKSLLAFGASILFKKKCGLLM